MILFRPPGPPRSEAGPRGETSHSKSHDMLILGLGKFFLVLEKYVPELEVCPASEMGMSLAVPRFMRAQSFPLHPWHLGLPLHSPHRGD